MMILDSGLLFLGHLVCTVVSYSTAAL